MLAYGRTPSSARQFIRFVPDEESGAMWIVLDWKSEA